MPKHFKSTEKPNVFQYHDYRKFLSDWIGYLRATEPGFSLRLLARKSGLASGYLPMVLSGTRNLSEKAWKKISRFLHLTPRERTFVDHLRLAMDSDSHEVRKEAFDRIQKVEPYRQNNPKELEVYRYLTHWYYVAIREMVTLPEFKADPAWIQSRLKGKVPLKEIEQALSFLIEKGYIEVKPNGLAHLREKDIRCEGDVFRIALFQFHREMLGLAIESLAATPSERRTVTGHTVAIAASQYAQVKTILDEALSKVAQLENSKDQSDSVYHIALAAFPLTREK